MMDRVLEREFGRWETVTGKGSARYPGVTRETMRMNM